MDLQGSIVDDKSGVSPVIGVILMVAVTVIIAAVIGSTALGLGESVSETPPQASFSVEQGEYTVTDAEDDTRAVEAVNITMENGENIETKNIDVTIDGKQAYSIVSPGDPEYRIYPNEADTDHPQVTNPFDRRGDTLSAGETTTILGRTDSLVNNDISLNNDRTTYSFPGSGEEIVETDSDPEFINKDEYEVNSGETIRIIWSADDGSSTTLYEQDIE